MIRIVFLLDAMEHPLGGTERQFLALLRHLDPGSFSTRLVLLREDGGESALDLPGPPAFLRCRSFAGPDLFRAGHAFAGICRNAEVVHTALRDATRVGPLWARLARVPVVVGSRRNLGYLYSGLDRALLRAMQPLTTHLVANSRAAAREAIRTEGFRESRISIIRNGLDPAAFAAVDPEARRTVREAWGFPPESLVAGAVANLRPVKHLTRFVEAAGEIAARIPEARFVILGEGGDRTRLEARIRDLGLEGRFVLPGVSHQAAREIHAFDVGVLTSDSESSPNALIEYLAAGKPAVSTDVGGAGEIVTPGTTGYLVRPGDAASLTARLLELLTDAPLRARFGDAARRDARERFSRDLMVAEHAALYERLVGARRGS